jgi:hypothetical protein
MAFRELKIIFQKSAFNLSILLLFWLSSFSTFASNSCQNVLIDNQRSSPKIENKLLPTLSRVATLLDNNEIRSHELEILSENILKSLANHEIELNHAFKQALEDILVQRGLSHKNKFQYSVDLEETGILDVFALAEGSGYFYERLFASPFSSETTKKIRELFEKDTGTNLEMDLHNLGVKLLYHGTQVGKKSARILNVGMRFGGGKFNESFTSSGDFGGTAIYTVDESLISTARAWGGKYRIAMRYSDLSIYKPVIEVTIKQDALILDSLEAMGIKTKSDGTLLKQQDGDAGLEKIKKFVSWLQDQRNRSAILEITPIASSFFSNDFFDFRIYQLLGIDIVRGAISGTSDVEYRILNPQIIAEKKIFNDLEAKQNQATLIRELETAIENSNDTVIEELIGKYNIPARFITHLFDRISANKSQEWISIFMSKIINRYPGASEGFISSFSVREQAFMLWSQIRLNQKVSIDDFEHPYFGDARDDIMNRMLYSIFLKRPPSSSDFFEIYESCVSIEKKQLIILNGVIHDQTRNQGWFKKILPTLIEDLLKGNRHKGVELMRILMEKDSKLAQDVIQELKSKLNETNKNAELKIFESWVLKAKDPS